MPAKIVMETGGIGSYRSDGSEQSNQARDGPEKLDLEIPAQTNLVVCSSKREHTPELGRGKAEFLPEKRNGSREGG